MRKYEMMYVLRPDLTEESTTAVVDKIKNLVTDQGGEITAFKEMGKRRLAYEIKHLREGVYFLMNFDATPEIVAELERITRISDEVIRYLVFRIDE